jgi:hypothetical protein
MMQFWSDDFDMDLLKIFPNAPKMLAHPDRVLWTVGHTSYGRLNNPCCWNTAGGGYGAFLWMVKPNLERDKYGWFNIGGYVANEPEVECTWLEWMRDAWAHMHAATILPTGRRLPPFQWAPFERIMYDLRGWHKRDVSEDRADALRWITRCDSIIEAAAGGSEEPDERRRRLFKAVVRARAQEFEF